MLKAITSLIFTKWCGRNVVCEKGTLKIHGLSRLGKNLHTGKNCNFNGAYIYGGGRVTIGENFHSGKGMSVLTQNHNYKGVAIPYDQSVVIKDVTIEDNVWVGMNVTILPGVRVGEGAIIQAAAVVSSDVPALSIVGGNPARIIKMRDADHYFKLKADGRFH